MAHPTWPDVIARLIAKQNLTAEETAWAINDVMDGNASGVVLAGFLTALAGKGETPAEIRGMSEAMLAHAVPLSVEGEQLDIVGTGGDRLKTVNVSTTAALVVAAAGVPVVKHGNRASSSASGAADCLEALGVAVDLPAEEVERVFAELGIAFVFANAFPPAMRFVSPTRRELGVATAFNILGPLTNPARPAVSAIGVSREDFAALVCGVLADRGSRGLVFRCRNGMDELSAAAPNDVWEVREGGVVHREFDAVDELGLPPATVDDLRGGEPDFNAEVTRAVLGGADGPVRQAVLLNAAGALVVADRHEGTRPGDGTFAERMRAAYEVAARSIDSGAAASLLDRWIELSGS